MDKKKAISKYILIPALGLPAILCIIMLARYFSDPVICEPAYAHEDILAVDPSDAVPHDIYGAGMTVDEEFTKPTYDIPDSSELSDAYPGLTHDSFDTSPTGYVEWLYNVTLGRDPDDYGYTYWVPLLESGEVSALDPLYAVIVSPEYASRNRSPAEVIYDLVKVTLDDTKDCDINSLAAYYDANMSLGFILSSYLGSEEHMRLCSYFNIKPGEFTPGEARDANYDRTAYITDLYRYCLNRNPDVEGLNYWCERLALGVSASEAASNFIFSDECLSKHHSNGYFVDMIYQTLLGRSPNEDEYEEMLNKLDHTNTRQHAFNSIITGKEFSKRCQRSGVISGDAISEPDSSRGWQVNIKVLELCNREREKNGLPGLITRSDYWQEISKERASELPSFFSHVRPDCRSWFTIFYDRNMDHFHSYENISSSLWFSPDRFMSALMKSDHHRDLILSPDIRCLTTGYVFSYAKLEGYCCQNYM